MAQDNLARMIKLAEEFFEVKNDPTQIAVTQDVMTRLRQIHASTITEERDADGPIAWILVIPTSTAIMELFLKQAINERELLEKTEVGAPYEAIYLCSALVLPEHRGKGLARRMTIKAIGEIMREHRISCLFVWPFSEEGKNLAEAVSKEIGLPLFVRSD